MEVPSLRPELGYELLKVILLRESYLKRLDQSLIKHHGQVDMTIIGLFDVLRELTVTIIELIIEWEQAQVHYPHQILPFLWNNENYLKKILTDMNPFLKYPTIQEWFGFSVEDNPFLVPPEAFRSQPAIVIPEEAYLVFGQAVDLSRAIHKKVKSGPYTKSPYTTPIINDPEVFTHLSAKNKLNRKFKSKLAGIAGGGGGGEEEVALTIQQQGALNQGNVKVAGYNPFLCYLSAEMLERIRCCFEKLLSVMVADHTSSSSSLPTIGRIKEKIAQEEELIAAIEGKKSMQELVEEEDGSIDQAGFLTSLKDHSKQHYRDMDQTISTHRYLIVSSLAKEQRQEQEQSALTFWTPHEVHLQKQVQRKGGELFTITVTSTAGRMKTPSRKPRYERMAVELTQTREEMERHGMVMEDAWSRIYCVEYRQQQLLQQKERENEKKESELTSHRIGETNGVEGGGVEAVSTVEGGGSGSTVEPLPAQLTIAADRRPSSVTFLPPVQEASKTVGVETIPGEGGAAGGGGEEVKKWPGDQEQALIDQLYLIFQHRRAARKEKISYLQLNNINVINWVKDKVDGRMKKSQFNEKKSLFHGFNGLYDVSMDPFYVV
eukprot:scaffold39_cov176-Ochromonas_danica.AAC.5